MRVGEGEGGLLLLLVVQEVVAAKGDERAVREGAVQAPHSAAGFKFQQFLLCCSCLLMVVVL